MHRSTILIVALCALIAGCQKGTDSAVSAGKMIFDENCAVCHGPEGNVRVAESYDAKTPDLRTIASRSPGGHMPRVMLTRIIDGRDIVQAHRVRNMPVWGERLNTGDGMPVEDKIEALLDYIESIQTD